MKKAFLLGICFLFFVNIGWGQIPTQYDLNDPRYDTFFNWAKKQVKAYKSECAKFVNRIFLARFGLQMWGDAWDLQIKKSNKPFITLIWKLSKKTKFRENLWYKDTRDREKHFEELYTAIESAPVPIGIAGFLYRYSSEIDRIKNSKNILPQSHVSFIAGEKNIIKTNTASTPKTIREIFEKEYGFIHDFEVSFIEKKLNRKTPKEAIKLTLKTKIDANKSFSFKDFWVEEHLKIVRHRSLLETFLQKHRNNKVSPLLRPVSFSRISDDIIEKLKNTEKMPFLVE